ncbi:Nonsense-mediated mrna decay protein [Globisporangium polare]
MMATDTSRLYREMVDIERQLRELLRSNPLNAQDANVLRSRLIEKAKMITQVNPAFAASKEIEQVLWKPCFYKRIEEFRLRIRKYASASSGDRSVREHFARVSLEFQQFLSDSAAFYDHLRESYSKFLLSNRVNGIANASGGQASSSSSAASAASAIARCRQSLHRCFIFMGDLARYRELHSQKAKKNFAAAESFYHKALALIPGNGNPHNQLAVLATYVEAETVAVYRYCRSLLIAQPFATAEENLALLFERSRQRPLAGPSLIPLTSATSSKDKSAFLKSFLHRLTRMHGILFSIATRAAKNNGNSAPGYSSSSNAPVYPREMENILFKDLNALLRAGVIGDALLLKLVVTNVFCLVRSLRGSSSARDDSFRLSTLTMTSVMDFLLEELSFKKSNGSSNSIESLNSLRLLGPVSVFCDFLRLNPKVLNILESELNDQPTASAFLESFASLVNHVKMKDLYAPLVNLRNDQQEPLRVQQLSLKENLELRGFAAFAALLEKSPAAMAKWNDEIALSSAAPNCLPETEALRIRAWNLYNFGKFLCDEYEGNPLLYFYQGTFSTSPMVVGSGGGSSSGGGLDISNSFLQAVAGAKEKTPSIVQMPTFNLGLYGSKDNGGSSFSTSASKQIPSAADDDDDFDDEVIVFQPSPAMNPMSATRGSGAFGAAGGDALGGGMTSSSSTSPFVDLSSPFSIGAPNSQSTPEPKRKSFSDSFGGGQGGGFGGSSSGLGSTLGYPSFHSFGDFGGFSGQGLLAGWGNSDASTTSNNGGGLGRPPSVPKPGSGGAFGLSSNNGAPFSPMMDLAAVERESALYQQEESSLSAFFNSSQRSVDSSSARTSPRPPPPPGFGGGAGLGAQSSAGHAQQQQQPQFYTRNPFINP